MPFDPHVIHPEEPPLDAAGDLQLPDDLAELAAQLGEDSKFLAELYPAKSFESSVQPACGFANPPAPDNATHINRSSRKLFRALALVASLTALIATTPLWFSRNTADRTKDIATNLETSSPEVADAPASAPEEPEPSTPIRSISEILPAPPAAAPPPPASRDAFLQDYSGPELEGLYDLIGDEEEDKISI